MIRDEQKKITIIDSKSDNLLSSISQILNYYDLFYYLALKDIQVLYAQTILGFLWAIIRPLFSMVIFSIIFGGLANIPSDGIPYPIFSYSALVPWIYFSTSLVKSSQSLVANKAIFTKVYFPRIIMPTTPILSGLIDFFIALSIVFLMMFYYNISPNINIIFIPLLIFIMILFSLGSGLWLSSLAIQYRDVRYTVQFMTQLLMYAAPVVWPVSLLLERYGDNIIYFYGLYPMAGVIEGFRSAILGINPMPWVLIITGLLSSLIIFISGYIYFLKKEKIFSDVS